MNRQPDSSRVCSDPRSEVQEAPEPQLAGKEPAWHLHSLPFICATSHCCKGWTGFGLWLSRQWNGKELHSKLYSMKKQTHMDLNYQVYFSFLNSGKIKLFKETFKFHLAFTWSTFSQPQTSWGNRQKQLSGRVWSFFFLSVKKNQPNTFASPLPFPLKQKAGFYFL